MFEQLSTHCNGQLIYSNAIGLLLHVCNGHSLFHDHEVKRFHLLSQLQHLYGDLLVFDTQ